MARVLNKSDLVKSVFPHFPEEEELTTELCDTLHDEAKRHLMETFNLDEKSAKVSASHAVDMKKKSHHATEVLRQLIEKTAAKKAASRKRIQELELEREAEE